MQGEHLIAILGNSWSLKFCDFMWIENGQLLSCECHTKSRSFEPWLCAEPNCKNSLDCALKNGPMCALRPPPVVKWLPRCMHPNQSLPHFEMSPHTYTQAHKLSQCPQPNPYHMQLSTILQQWESYTSSGYTLSPLSPQLIRDFIEAHISCHAHPSTIPT